MRRNYFTLFLAAGLFILLIVLGVLQYRWQTEISDSEAQRMHKLAQEYAGRFSEDFNKEIQNAYFNFDVGADDWSAANYHPFVDRYEFWRAKTAYPGLISEFYFFNAEGKNAPLKFDAEEKTFTPVEWSPELKEIYSRTQDQKNFRAVNEDIYTLILPEHESPQRVEHIILRRSPAMVKLGEQKEPDIPPALEMPKTYGYLVMRLDEGVIRDKILPDLAAKYFDDNDYRISVTTSDGKPVYETANLKGVPDAQSSLFELSPNDVYFFANRDLANSLTEHKESGTMTSHIENRTMTRSVSNTSQGTVQVEIQNGGQQKTRVFTTTGDSPEGRWTLSAQHSAGSIDAYIANTKYRNLAGGFGILGLLGLSAGAIMFSAQRAKAYAQRQIDFVSSVSHEFRTPLAVIYSAGENLADGVTNDPSQTARYGELIKGEGRKLSAMVEQILEFAGASSGKRKLSLRPASVAEIVSDAIAECRPLLDAQNVELENDADVSLPTVNADHAALSRAIQNLITNSIKYRDGSSWVRVSARNGDGKVKISVEDRGIGISKDELGQIFEPFYRAKSVVDAQIHGNGLGLSIVKQIVEAHGGHVTAESEPGVGSKFTIELPCN